MKAREFWKTVVADRSDFLDKVVALLTEYGIRFCVIGDQAVNAYAEPVVSLDLALVIAAEQIGLVESLSRREFEVQRFPFSLNVSLKDSDLRLQVTTDPRYAAFVDRSTVRDVLGVPLPVADIRDVLQGKVWAASDPQRQPSKRLKDLADIARLLGSDAELRNLVPPDLLAKVS